MCSLLGGDIVGYVRVVIRGLFNENFVVIII